MKCGVNENFKLTHYSEFAELDSIKGASYDEKLLGIENGARGRQAIAGYKA